MTTPYQSTSDRADLVAIADRFDQTSQRFMDYHNQINDICTAIGRIWMDAQSTQFQQSMANYRAQLNVMSQQAAQLGADVRSSSNVYDATRAEVDQPMTKVAEAMSTPVTTR